MTTSLPAWAEELLPSEWTAIAPGIDFQIEGLRVYYESNRTRPRCSGTLWRRYDGKQACITFDRLIFTEENIRKVMFNSHYVTEQYVEARRARRADVR